jgi:hypothetical protein
MYSNEGIHRRPHFHVRYSGHHASVAFDGEIIAGSLPARAHRMVRDWAALHADELDANWQRALADEPLERIEPLP